MTDLHETWRVHTVHPQLLQRQLFDVRFLPQTGGFIWNFICILIQLSTFITEKEPKMKLPLFDFGAIHITARSTKMIFIDFEVFDKVLILER